MALAASKYVQKYRSRKNAASRRKDAESTGVSSSTASMSLRPSVSPSLTSRTTPSVRRLPAPKGADTRMPGSTFRLGGTR